MAPGFPSTVPARSDFGIDDLQVLPDRFQKRTIGGHERDRGTDGRFQIKSGCAMNGIVRAQGMPSHQATRPPEHIVVNVDANRGLPNHA